jgi:hypothetical protein
MYSEFDKPRKQHLSGNDRLDDISSIQAIHTIGPKNTLLRIFLIGSLSIIEWDLNMKVAIVFNLNANLVKQLGQILIFHLFALGVEVKPNQFKIGIVRGVMHLLEILAKPLLRTLLIYQIYQSAVLVARFNAQVILFY